MRQNVIVGTAGHVDHGKTCLIKALTGIDTDRLQEEKKRGITIELGFANMPNDRGLHIGIIDVPGHEKFVKNMLAGIGGMDLVLLVVALDEGVMPQTVEHFEILKMLGIRRGLVVLTKADLVEPAWADMVEEDVKELLSGSFMENADCLRVSAYTGENIDRLKEKILEAAAQVESRRKDPALFRLPIDRVFTMEGFGTVVTGTLMEGSCRVGEELMLYPQEVSVKIRGIQSHGHEEAEAFAGQRTALNLAGVKKEEVARGAVLARPKALENTRLLDARVTLFSSTKRRLKNGDRVHFHYGSAQTLARAVLLNAQALSAGESAYVQFHLNTPAALCYKDRFIIRFYSPVESIGGGIILDEHPGKTKRYQEEVLESLAVRETTDPCRVLEEILKEESPRFPRVACLAMRLHEPREETEALLNSLQKEKTAVALADGSFLHRRFWEKITEEAAALLEAFHKENPIAAGMEKEEFTSRLLGAFYLKDRRKGEVLLGELIRRGLIRSAESTVALSSFTAAYSAAHDDMRAKLLRTYSDAGLEAPATEQVLTNFADKRQAKQVLADLEKAGLLVKLSPAVFMDKRAYERALSLVRNHFAGNETLSLAQFRDMAGTSRKYSQLFLEHLDKQKLTRMQGDVRIILRKF